jgi:hypothetical protein
MNANLKYPHRPRGYTDEVMAEVVRQEVERLIDKGATLEDAEILASTLPEDLLAFEACGNLAIVRGRLREAKNALYPPSERRLHSVRDEPDMADSVATGQEPPAVGRTAAELLAEETQPVDFLTPGLLIRNQSTLVVAREKAGKGTLAFSTIGCLESGLPTAFGPAYPERVTSVILTEEPMESVREKLELFGIREAFIVYGWELSGLAWPEKVAYVADKAVERGAGLVFVDNVSRQAGIDDEAGVELARAIEPAIDLFARVGLTSWFDHHANKSRSGFNASRGTTALPGAVDVYVVLSRVSQSSPTDRRRKMIAEGRLRATNWELAIELSEDGRTFRALDDMPGDEDGGDNRRRLMEDVVFVLENGRRATKRQLADAADVGERAAQKRLHALVEAGWATKLPKGDRPADPETGKPSRADWWELTEAGERTARAFNWKPAIDV